MRDPSLLPVINFEDAIRLSSNKMRNVLIGNGLSIAFSPASYHYEQLKTVALDWNKNLSRLNNLFNILNTSDIEKVIRWLETAAEILPTISLSSAPTASECRDLAERLRNALIVAIHKLHPSNRNSLTTEHVQCCQTFLSYFVESQGQIFTTNYDLLLYWVHMRSTGFWRRDLKDGFWCQNPSADKGTVWSQWEAHGSQGINYIHGALHIFHHPYGAQKIVYDGNDIIDKIQGKIDSGELPLFVAEGNWISKLQKIVGNPYLNYCYNRLKKCHGDMFIFGHRLCPEHDHHLSTAIAESQISRLFVSLHGRPHDNIELVNRSYSIKECSRGRISEIHFFNADSASVWTQNYIT